MVTPCFSGARYEWRLSGAGDSVRNKSGEQIVKIHELPLLWELSTLGLQLKVVLCQMGLIVSRQRLVRTFPMTMVKGPLLIIAGSSTIINTKTSRNRT